MARSQRAQASISELNTFSEEDEGEWQRRVAWFKKLASGGWTGIEA